MSTTTNTQRAVSLVLALVFLFSTIGVVALIVAQSNQQAKQQQELQDLLTNKTQIACSIDNALNYKPEAPMQGKPLPNYTPQADIAELGCIDIVVGTGVEAKANDTVTAHYTGAVAATGIVFQSSIDSGSPIPFGLNQVIQGWSKGVPGMKEGGKRRLLIPSALAYGANPPAGSGIPADADLVFDVELVKVGN